MPQYLLTPLIAFLVAQGTKFFLKALKRKISWREFFAYSDMPSGHTAVVISLATIIFLKEGFQSPIFAVSVFFAAIVIADAVGLRRYLGEHGKTLNILVKDLKEDDYLDKRYPHLLERIGHTPTQVFAGALVGSIVAIIVWLF